jgi:hypothetical protein
LRQAVKVAYGARAARPISRIAGDPDHVLVEPTHRRAFQGWRYLKADDAPPDIAKARKAPFVDPKMTKEMQKELRKLGLL